MDRLMQQLGGMGGPAGGGGGPAVDDGQVMELI